MPVPVPTEARFPARQGMEHYALARAPGIRDSARRIKGPMRVLLVTGMYPARDDPMRGIFVRAQVESLAAAGVTFEPLLIHGRSSRFDYLRAIVRVSRRAAQGGLDLVHAHGGLAGFVAVQQRRVPVLITFHGTDLQGVPSPRGGLTPASRLQCALSQIAARRAARVITVSPALAAQLDRRLPRADVIPMGVDLRLFRPGAAADARARLGLDDRPRVLFVGRTEAAVKRVRLAQEAVAAVRPDVPDVELMTMNRRPQDQVVDAMNACDCLLLTSSREGSPMVVKEAMACNLPIVSTRVGDVEERFGGMAGHYLVEPSAPAIAGALKQALAFGRTQGRERVLSLDLPVIARRILCVYQDTCGRGRL